MTTWMVDDGPFGDLALTFDPAWTWPAATLHVVETLARSAAKDRSLRRGTLLAMKDAKGNGCIVTHSIAVDSVAAKMVYGHLRKNSSTSDGDLGEHEAIAYCACEDKTSVFVAADKLACFAALSELGRDRVATPFDLWWDLKERRLITEKVFESLMQRSVKTSGLHGRPLRFP